MNDAEQKHKGPIRTAIPFTGEERERYEAFKKATGRSTSPFIKVLLMREVTAWEKSLSSQDQASELRKMMEQA
ncbi:MAG: hypothetical protein PQJ59_01655 [Spirochaetales bacterium]|nr:hypothetical protein [Spirochaetales bacterium]